MYVINNNIGWLNTFYTFIVPAFHGCGAIFITLPQQLFLTSPVALEDAARKDGCNDIRVLAQICLPLSEPVLCRSRSRNTISPAAAHAPPDPSCPKTGLHHE